MGEAVARIGLAIAIAAAGVLAKKGTEKLWDEVIEPWIDEHGDELWERLQEALPWLSEHQATVATVTASPAALGVRAELDDGCGTPARARGSSLSRAVG